MTTQGKDALAMELDQMLLNARRRLYELDQHISRLGEERETVLRHAVYLRQRLDRLAIASSTPIPVAERPNKSSAFASRWVTSRSDADLAAARDAVDEVERECG